MIAHPTHILRTTRSGSRWHVRWLNQPAYCGKGEPNRRSRCSWTSASIDEPDAKSGTPSVPVESDASSLLVILHYLLKNNTSFMGGIGQGRCAPSDSCCPNVGQRKSADLGRGGTAE